MKKYHLFVGYQYYPDSGLGDYKGSFEDLDEASNAGEEKMNSGTYSWYYVIGHNDDGSLVELDNGWRNL